MTEPVIKRQLVWPISIRLTHLIMASCVIGLLVTGFLLQNMPYGFYTTRDYHYLFAYGLTSAWLWRIYLFVRSKNNAASWREFIPGSRAKSNMIAMVRFYVSLGRTPLPNWYAHNPLWLPLYLFIFIILIIQITTGFLIATDYLIYSVDIYQLHDTLTAYIFWFTVAHILAVILHDIKGTGSDISAMLNGYRIFVIDKPSQDLLSSKSQKVTFPPTYSSPGIKPTDKP